MKPKLYVPDQPWYADPFSTLFDIVPEPDDADVILLTGGSDIDPAFYGEPKGKFTHTQPARDVREKALFDKSYQAGKKFLGICRGAQLLCALDGGKLAQHINGHNGGFHSYHRVMTSEGREYNVNSVHHQMMIPAGDAEVLAWSESLSGVYLDGWNQPILGVEVEPEVVFFPEIQGLGIQCHPEALPKVGNTMHYFHKLIQERLL